MNQYHTRTIKQHQEVNAKTLDWGNAPDVLPRKTNGNPMRSIYQDQPADLKIGSELINTPHKSNAVENTRISGDSYSLDSINNTGKKTIGEPQESSPSEAISENSKAASQQTPEKKKDKKLVFLSRSVLRSVRETPMTTGTEIAYEILELYKQFSDKVDFKNV